MEPKHKALELFSTYRFMLSLPNAPLGEHKDRIAKECALHTVTEVIEALGYDDDAAVRKLWWNKVTEEIEKI